MNNIPDIIPTYFTLAGDISPFGSTTVSPHAFIDRVRAASEAGYRGFGFGFQDLVHILDHMSYEDINHILDDHGLIHRELEVLVDWFVDGDRRQASDHQRRIMLDAARRLNARHIKVAGDVTGATWPMDHIVTEFATLCDQAKDADTAITIELFPTSNICDLQTGRAIVEGADRPNGGLLLDIWHMVRANIPMSAIAALPPGIINHVELDDCTLAPQGPFMQETLECRMLPGDGEFPLEEFLTALKATGYDGLYGVEILSNDFRKMPLIKAATLSYKAAQKLFLHA
ncbi:MAG: sugar phosphate isomerase/epimerase [Emcibacter sp.]|nr:sugar phosphate isomerase/epimerase [Emcibacter sp.]